MRPFRMTSSVIDEDPDPVRDEPEEPPGRRLFHHIPLRLWNDWRWQLTHRIHDPEELGRRLGLLPSERAAFATAGARLPLAVTPYYLRLISESAQGDALRRTVIPEPGELLRSPDEADDPLGEEAASPIPGLVHRYPDRVLVLATGRCAAYCRYCTRSRRVGEHGHRSAQQGEVVGYLRSHPEVRDVILSGGDPLTLPDHELETWLKAIRSVPHVQIIRIGTRTPAVLPMRITPSLVRMIRRYHPVYMSIHATHPAELSPRMRRACELLADGGIPLGSQTVLLAGINDSVEVMRELMQGLLACRVRPYYLYQCDPISGSRHFRTPVRTGLEIIAGLRGFTSGYGVPTYVIDAPGGGGKIALLPDAVVSRDDSRIVLRNWQGAEFSYPDGVDT